MHRLRLDVTAADKERGRLEGRLAAREREIGALTNKAKAASEQHKEELKAAKKDADELQKKVCGPGGCGIVWCGVGGSTLCAGPVGICGRRRVCSAFSCAAHTRGVRKLRHHGRRSACKAVVWKGSALRARAVPLTARRSPAASGASCSCSTR